MRGHIIQWAILPAFFVSLSFGYDWSTNPGTGEPNNPYQISTPEQLMSIGSNADLLDKCFILVNDIIFDPNNNPNHVFSQALIKWFSGSFNGNGNCIFNLKIEGYGTNYVGLFYLADGVIANLDIANADITGVENVGILAGLNSYSGQVSNCTVMGSVKGGQKVGGLIGANSGVIRDCYANVYIIGEWENVGGLVGLNQSDGEISGCSAAGPVAGPHQLVGGLVGQNISGTISNCWASGSVSGDEFVGGLVGYNRDTIVACRGSGQVAGDSICGGLAGGNYGTISDSCAFGSVNGSGVGFLGGLCGNNSGTISNCYATGSVTDTDNLEGIGGLVGRNGGLGTVRYCYAVGEVAGNCTGGLVGDGSCLSVTFCFWDVESSNQPSSQGGRGLTTVQMKTLSIFRNAGWSGTHWVMDDSQDTPRLIWESTGYPPIPEAEPVPLSGSGIATDPFQIHTPDDFALLSGYAQILDSHMILLADINLSGMSLLPIGDISSFIGVFNGNGHSISNATIHMPATDFVGLFGYVGFGGKIQDLSLFNIDIIGDDEVGSLVGYNYGSIQNCCSIGSVSGDWYVGGLAGDNGGKISQSYANGFVTGNSCVGGLAGYNYGTINGCYATESVSGAYYRIGGLVGDNKGLIKDCYANIDISADAASYIGGVCGQNGSTLFNCYVMGSIFCQGNSTGGITGYSWGSIDSCYFLDTAGLDNGYGEPLTETQMKQRASFVGWDFVGEDINGTEDIWRMCEDGVHYPKLNWEYLQRGDFICPDGVGIADADVFGGCWLAQVDLDTELEDDGDTVVSLPELARIGQYWLAVGCGDCGGMDLTGDGEVTMEDLSAVAGDWLAVVYPECGMADLNGDDFVDLADWAVFAGHWMEGE